MAKHILSQPRLRMSEAKEIFRCVHRGYSYNHGGPSLPLGPAQPSPTMSHEDPKDELERLRKENEALKKGTAPAIRMKVSEKGSSLGLRDGALSGHFV
jgi:hypothetical protein